MKILTLNCWGGAIHRPLLEYLGNVDADVVCLQEVTHDPEDGSRWLTYRDGAHVLEQRSGLYDEIAAVLPDHLGRFAAAARGPLFEPSGREVLSDWGIAIFVRRSLPVIGAKQAFIHGSYSASGWGDHPRARNAMLLHLHDHRRRLTVVNLHGLRDPSGKHDTPARLAQAERLVRLITPDGGDSAGEMIICGDFNVLPDSETFRRLAALGLIDLVTSRGISDTRTSLYTRHPRHADYMLVSGGVDVRGFEVVAQPEVSDHRPLVLTIA